MIDSVLLSVSQDVSVDERKLLVHGIATKNIHRFDNMKMLCVHKQKGI